MRMIFDEEAIKKQRDREERFEHSKQEPVWFLRCIPYGEYINHSRWWEYRRGLFLEKWDGTCHCCDEQIKIPIPDQGQYPVIDRRLGEAITRLPFAIVHHLRYDNLRDEPDEDLSVVCSPCHQLIHHPKSWQARNWLAEHEDPGKLKAKARAITPPWTPSKSDHAPL